MVIFLLKLNKSAITQPKIVQIPKFWCLHSCTIIWPSYENIYSTKIIILAGFQGKESPKTIKNWLNFPFINNKMLNNSFFPPWTDYLPHIARILMSICFFWHTSLEWASKFLLWSFMDGVPSFLLTRGFSNDYNWYCSYFNIKAPPLVPVKAASAGTCWQGI